VLRPEDAAAGRDTQIEAAVKVLLSQLPAPAVASTQD
jgi:hypothetical protein